MGKPVLANLQPASDLDDVAHHPLGRAPPLAQHPDRLGMSGIVQADIAANGAELASPPSRTDLTSLVDRVTFPRLDPVPDAVANGCGCRLRGKRDGRIGSPAAAPLARAPALCTVDRKGR